MRFAFLLVLPLALFACVQNEATEPDDPIANGNGPLAMAKRKWNTHKPAHFRYTYYQSCFCFSGYFGPYQVTATSDSVLEVEGFQAVISPDSEPVKVSVKVAGDLRSYSIDSVFSLVSRVQKDTANVVLVKFNDSFGYPESVFVNPQLFSVDGGMLITIKDFRGMENAP